MKRMTDRAVHASKTAVISGNPSPSSKVWLSRLLRTYYIHMQYIKQGRKDNSSRYLVLTGFSEHRYRRHPPLRLHVQALIGIVFVLVVYKFLL